MEPIALNMNRRLALKTLGLSAVGLTGILTPFRSVSAAAAPGKNGFTLPELPYSFAALEPAIDEETMRIHHGKHHAGYIDKLNQALEKEESLQGKSIVELLSDLDSIPESVRESVRNQGGGHYNHELFWPSLTPESAKPEGRLAEDINATFGSLEQLLKEMEDQGKGVFGSGWVWLSLDGNRKLIVETTANQDNPVMHGNTPLLGIDVWEHAYYLKYQNKRAEYLPAVLGKVNWPEIALRYQRAH